MNLLLPAVPLNRRTNNSRGAVDSQTINNNKCGGAAQWAAEVAAGLRLFVDTAPGQKLERKG